MVVAVRDNGMGIEPEVIGRVFKAFEQGDESFQRRHGGLGLGLAISKAIADGHGATLVAASDGRDRGTTFRLTMSTTKPPAVTAKRKPATGEVTRRRLRILLVDDHADTCTALERLLALRGHHIATAHDVRSALESAERDPFDLLISDVGLPDGTGAELMTRLSAAGTVRGIAISGFGMDSDVQRSLNAGFSEHLTKPVNIEKLENAIERAMSGVGKEVTGNGATQGKPAA